MMGAENPSLDIDRIIDDRRTRIIVCCGSGGVGKTTTAAAIGLRAHRRPGPQARAVDGPDVA
jgi:flagellar biosynthesis GTPase FlhF